MLAIIIGGLDLLAGLAVLLLPLLLTELSRPRDGAWAAVLLILGLLLVANYDRFNSSSIFADVLGALLISRLGIEVAQSRWQQLSEKEKLRLGSLERWSTGLNQLIAAFVQLGKVVGETITFPDFKNKPSSRGKKWVRPEPSEDQLSNNGLPPITNEELKDSNETSREKF